MVVVVLGSAMGKPPALVAVWDPRFREYDFGPDHPFAEGPRDLAVRLLEASVPAPGSARVEWVREVEGSSRGSLLTFHSSDYLDRVLAAGESRNRRMLDAGDTPSFPGCYDAARRIVGGMERAVDLSLERNGPAFHPAGGLHHAAPDRASGFCIFNDLAVGIRRALERNVRVAYLDLDVHHGDGVMYGFYDSGRVLDIDFHEDGRGQFPGTGFPDEAGRGDGAGWKVNVPLPPGAGDEAFLPLFRRVVPPMLEAFRPELVVVQHGVDAHWGDPLGHLQYTPSAYREALRSVVELASGSARGRLVVTGGGGYRAASVSRVLAAAGLAIAGLPVPGPRHATPEGWRVQYFEELGEPAPEGWADPPRLAASPWSRDREDRLIAELEASLGRRFPRPPPAGPGRRARGSG
jgi:acetoin utilization protein AcuC